MESVEAIAPQAAELFYSNFFKADPSLEQRFKGDMTNQGQKLRQMLGVADGKVDGVDTLVFTLNSLATRYLSYDVKDEHYDTVGSALLKS